MGCTKLSRLSGYYDSRHQPSSSSAIFTFILSLSLLFPDTQGKRKKRTESFPYQNQTLVVVVAVVVKQRRDISSLSIDRCIISDRKSHPKNPDIPIPNIRRKYLLFFTPSAPTITFYHSRLDRFRASNSISFDQRSYSEF